MSTGRVKSPRMTDGWSETLPDGLQNAYLPRVMVSELDLIVILIWIRL
jgi:hypothetical protein